ncbi:hypothetical protein LCGC14_1280430 [marine sediment metagenome]|uniref:Uncharacterized protein n=1 Tax=marine sediment metagenome TaxID=412755 RepID=A0A0F9LGM1_9ZZZZ
MIGEFIANSIWVSIIILALIAAFLFIRYSETKKKLYGIVLLLLIGGYIFVIFEYSDALGQQAQDFCLNKKLNYYDWSDAGLEIQCYKTTNGSAEIITFKEINGEMYQVTS